MVPLTLTMEVHLVYSDQMQVLPSIESFRDMLLKLLHHAIVSVIKIIEYIGTLDSVMVTFGSHFTRSFLLNTYLHIKYTH